jgi:hypothetical protein
VSTIAVEFSHENLVRDLKRAAIGLAMFCGITMLAHCGTGCLPAIQPTVDQDYTSEIVSCAAMAGYPGQYDKAEDLKCRAAVDCKYKVGPCP